MCVSNINGLTVYVDKIQWMKNEYNDWKTKIENVEYKNYVSKWWSSKLSRILHEYYYIIIFIKINCSSATNTSV